MEEDREILAMSQINTALNGLSEEERYRVMQWAANKHLQNTPALKLAVPPTVTPPAGLMDNNAGTDTETGDHQAKDEAEAYDTFAEMLDASGASKDIERFLMAAYWLQVVKQQANWKSFEVNKLLKDTGHQIDNVSNALRDLSKKSKTRPALVVQLSKNAASSGKGSKVLKLTTEGIKKAAQMLGEEK